MASKLYKVISTEKLFPIESFCDDYDYGQKVYYNQENGDVEQITEDELVERFGVFGRGDFPHDKRFEFPRSFELGIAINEYIDEKTGERKERWRSAQKVAVGIQEENDSRKVPTQFFLSIGDALEGNTYASVVRGAPVYVNVLQKSEEIVNNDTLAPFSGKIVLPNQLIESTNKLVGSVIILDYYIPCQTRCFKLAFDVDGDRFVICPNCKWRYSGKLFGYSAYVLDEKFISQENTRYLDKHKSNPRLGVVFYYGENCELLTRHDCENPLYLYSA